jgi:hypothetical protein
MDNETVELVSIHVKSVNAERDMTIRFACDDKEEFDYAIGRIRAELGWQHDE